MVVGQIQRLQLKGVSQILIGYEPFDGIVAGV